MTEPIGYREIIKALKKPAALGLSYSSIDSIESQKSFLNLFKISDWDMTVTPSSFFQFEIPSIHWHYCLLAT